MEMTPDQEVATRLTVASIAWLQGPTIAQKLDPTDIGPKVSQLYTEILKGVRNAH